jgi:hypothetical protein
MSKTPMFDILWFSTVLLSLPFLMLVMAGVPTGQLA